VMGNGPSSAQPIVRVDGLVKHFPLGRRQGTVYAVNGVSFAVGRGETLGLVGESGSGKTTVGRCILRIIEPSEGAITFDGVDLAHLPERELRRFRPRMQIVFQEPGASLDPRYRIGRSIEEPLRYRGDLDATSRLRRVRELLDFVKLPEAIAGRYPHELTAGEQQRVGIARAVATNPDLIVLDEPTASLDVSVRGEILTLLKRLQQQLGLAYLFISHDLTAVERLSGRIAIMYLGHIVEIGPAASIFAEQVHPYARGLLSSVLEPDPEQRRPRFVLSGEIPSPIEVPRGCALAGRCPIRLPHCATVPPPPTQVTPGHIVACHRTHEILDAGSIESVLQSRTGKMPVVTASP
jgi:oligopeptide/dipeptide ABC transporter ATP-binding protein